MSTKIDNAREYFENLKKTNYPEIYEAELSQLLKAERVGFEALDPNGRKSALRMRLIYNVRSRASHIKSAFQASKDLLHSGTSKRNTLSIIGNDLKCILKPSW